MCIKSIALAAAVLGLFSTSVFANIVTETYTGTVTGYDDAGYFGTPNALLNTTFTATYVFDTNLSGAAQQHYSGSYGNYSKTYGGSGFSLLSPALSASLLINGKTFNVPNVNQSSYSTELYLQSLPGNFYSEAYVSPTSGSYLENFMYTQDPNAPALVPASLTTPFTYTYRPVGTAANQGFFVFGDDYLSLYSDTVTQSPFAPTPLPPALPLFVSALAGFGLIGWRQHKSRRASATVALR